MKCKGEIQVLPKKGFYLQHLLEYAFKNFGRLQDGRFFLSKSVLQRREAERSEILREARKPHRFHPFSVPLSFDSSAGARVLNLGEIRRGCLRSKTLGTRMKIA